MSIINLITSILFPTTGIFLLLITAFISFLLIKTYIGKGKSIRDPTHPPVLGTVFHQLRHLKRLFDHQAEVTLKHPTFRLLAPDHCDIYTADVRNVEHILKTRFENYQRGEFGVDIVKDLLGGGIFMVNGDKWLHQRKLASVEFSARVLRDFSCGVFRRNAAKLVENIAKSFSVQNKAFDIVDPIMKSAMDSISTVAFGEELNCLDGSSTEAIQFMKAVDDAHGLIFWRFSDPFWKLKRTLNIGSEAQLKQYLKVIDSYIHGVIIRRKRKMFLLLDKEPALPSDSTPVKWEKQDILSRFMIASKKGNDPDDQISDQYLRDVFINFMFAGKDAVANTLSWFICMICKNPLVQERIAQEVKQVILADGSKLEIDDSVELVTDEALEKMHYLHAALTETLRLYPVVPIGGRTAVKDDVLPDGYKVNKGDNVNYVAYAMGRMPYIWGDQAHEFLPERWLDQNGVFKPESPFKFVSFHGGPRSCLGKDFAYRLMKIMSATLIHFFRFQLADDTKNITYKIMFNLPIDGGLHVYAQPRNEVL